MPRDVVFFPTGVGPGIPGPRLITPADNPRTVKAAVQGVPRGTV